MEDNHHHKHHPKHHKHNTVEGCFSLFAWNFALLIDDNKKKKGKNIKFVLIHPASLWSTT